jgi:hypothetical protein
MPCPPDGSRPLPLPRRDTVEPGRTSARRSLPLLVALAAAAAFYAAPSANAATRRLESPRLSDIAVATGRVDYRNVGSVAARLAASPFWGGEYTASTGEKVKIFASTSYPVDDSVGQKWANFLASLVHGSELSLLTTYLETPREVSAVCGQDALACYSDRDSTLIAPGEDTQDISAEALITHEYGHHVAAHRRNAPWPAVDWGTKRWATYENVCARARANRLYPGGEDARHYELNPGEGFAEQYRVLNERRAGIPETPWEIVDPVLMPDSTSLSRLQQDVLTPWTRNAVSTSSGSFSAVAKSRSFTVATPLDGRISVTVRAPRTGRLSVALFTGGKRVSLVTARAGAAATAKSTVCGARSFVVRVSRVAGAGRYTASVSRP